MKDLMNSVRALFLTILGCACFLVVHGQSVWKLQWQDEFNGEGLPDSNYWSYDIGGRGWGNNELQYYTKADTANVKMKNGYLLLTAKKEDKAGKKYTSVRLHTKNKVDIRYGRLEVRAMLPKGLGLWPAIWMLPTDWKYGGWPNSGEIDIMEHVGFTPDTVYGSVHTKKFNHVIGTQKTSGLVISNPYNQFHTYAIEWTEKGINFFLDNVRYYQFNRGTGGSEEWPFDQRFHLLLNIAVGGNWGGKKGIDDTVFPATMRIDFVRYYTRP